MPSPENSHSNEQSRKRRTHRKSRKGCKACKARRTKCDEQGPPCVNCAIRGTECIYDVPDSEKAKPIDEISPAPSSTISSSSSSQTPKSLLELELLFRWTTATADSLGDLAKDGQSWRIEITKMAFNFEPLLNAIFAVSAAHFADDSNMLPDNRGRYVDASLEYYGRCCEIFRNELVNINSENGRAILYCSLILIILRLHIPSFGNEDESCLNRVLAAFELLQGTWSIVHVIHDEKEGLLSAEYLASKYEVGVLEAEVSQALDCLRLINQQNYEGNDMVKQTLCDKAIHSLRQWWERSHLKSHGTALIWLFVAPREFIQLVRDGNSMARLIVLHWSVLFDEVYGDSKWWSRSIGKRLILELSVMLDTKCQENEAWRDARAWTKSRVMARNPTLNIQSMRLRDVQSTSEPISVSQNCQTRYNDCDRMRS